jgi:glycosyltransferase involved in cell wall biosynthesis
MKRVPQRVSVVIPANNEKQSIAAIVQDCKKYCDEVIVVDDGSTDGTGAVADRAWATVIRNNSRSGIVRSLMRGIEVASGEIIVTLDADGQHNPEEITDLVQPILEGRADLVLGCRSWGIPFSERMITKLVNFRVRCNDAGTGYRAVRTGIARRMRLWGACVCGSFVLEASRCGARVAEVPIAIQPRRYGKSHWASPFSRGYAHGIQLLDLIAWMVAFRDKISVS